MTRLGRAFVWGLFAVLGLGLTLRFAIAAREWFISDDFFFLAQVQDASWRFREALLPTRPRMIAAYRPIGLDAYFMLNFGLFGWNAAGYYFTALVLQALTGLLVARMARGYGIDRRVTWVVAASMVLAAPSTLESYAVAEHNYICAALCYSACLALLLAELARPRPWLRLASYAALVLGLLSNEVCATFPVVALLAAYRHVPGNARRSLLNALRLTWPYAAIAALYVDFKLWGVPLRQKNWFYEVDVGTDMLGNFFGNLAHVHGGYIALTVVFGLAVLLAVARFRGALAPLSADQAKGALVGAAWLLATSLPFTVLALPASRFALLQLPAAALIWAVLLDVARRWLPPARQAIALIAALTLLTPWVGMVNALRTPRGAVFRDAYHVVARALPPSSSTCVRVFCAGPQLASEEQCAAFRTGTFGGALWRAVVSNRPLAVEFTDAVSPDDALREFDCQRYYLTPELTLTTEPPQTLHVSAWR